MTSATSRAAFLLAALSLTLGCGPSQAKKTLCANNLKQLWILQYAHAKKEGGKSVMPRSTGAAFWLSLEGSPDVASEPDVFVCPLSGKAAGKGVTTYRGPKADVNTLPAEAVVGCCTGFHGDGSVTVLRKDGSVVLEEKGSAVQKEALEATKP